MDQQHFSVLVPTSMEEEDLVCSVCGSVGRLCNKSHGANEIVCRACKSFFEYHTQRATKGQGNPRKNQQRFKKCLEVGMKAELVGNQQDKKHRRRKKPIKGESPSKPRSPCSSRSPSPQSSDSSFFSPQLVGFGPPPQTFPTVVKVKNPLVDVDLLELGQVETKTAKGLHLDQLRFVVPKLIIRFPSEDRSPLQEEYEFLTVEFTPTPPPVPDVPGIGEEIQVGVLARGQIGQCNAHLVYFRSAGFPVNSFESLLRVTAPDFVDLDSFPTDFPSTDLGNTNAPPSAPDSSGCGIFSGLGVKAPADVFLKGLTEKHMCGMMNRFFELVEEVFSPGTHPRLTLQVPRFLAWVKAPLPPSQFSPVSSFLHIAAVKNWCQFAHLCTVRHANWSEHHTPGTRARKLMAALSVHCVDHLYRTPQMLAVQRQHREVETVFRSAHRKVVALECRKDLMDLFMVFAMLVLFATSIYVNVKRWYLPGIVLCTGAMCIAKFIVHQCRCGLYSRDDRINYITGVFAGLIICLSYTSYVAYKAHRKELKRTGQESPMHEKLMFLSVTETHQINFSFDLDNKLSLWNNLVLILTFSFGGLAIFQVGGEAPLWCYLCSSVPYHLIMSFVNRKTWNHMCYLYLCFCASSPDLLVEPAWRYAPKPEGSKVKPVHSRVHAVFCFQVLLVVWLAWQPMFYLLSMWKVSASALFMARFMFTLSVLSIVDAISTSAKNSTTSPARVGALWFVSLACCLLPFMLKALFLRIENTTLLVFTLTLTLISLWKLLRAYEQSEHRPIVPPKYLWKGVPSSRRWTRRVFDMIALQLKLDPFKPNLSCKQAPPVPFDQPRQRPVPFLFS
eukprot:m.192450 g.192450  ORF g.192450 m.192450 type:complete len:841 (-) comp25739_c0_seq20:74-2596(-)